MATIEFFFDCSSPWTYLAFHNIQPLAAELGATITWRPILVGGIFNTVNPSVYEGREHPVPAKARYSGKDMQDWARWRAWRSRCRRRVFPVNSVKAMRGCIVLEPQGKLVDFARAAFEAYWGEDARHLQGRGARRGLRAAPASMPPALLRRHRRAGDQGQLRANTDELMARGGFGSPTMFVNGDDMYFGNDRLPLVRAALERAA